LAILTNTDAKDLSAKRYQTKMLLVSLIESFCRSYGDSPDANRKVFFLICQTLRSLGIIDAEFVDEMTSVRSAFQDAFRKLFFTAVQTVQNQDLMTYPESSRKMITAEKGNSESESEKQDECYFSPIDYSGKNMTDDRFLSASSTCSSRLQDFVTDSTPSFFQNLSIQNSRYHNDFVELNLLGKGGFATAFRARNKLDGIEYAIKKIRLGKDIEEEGLDESQNPYEKIFREIKSLARLEHHNVIRYYSSWLEYDEGKEAAAIDRFSGSSDWGEDDYSDDEPDSSLSSPRHDESSSGFFHGYEPHFDDDASFGMPISTPGEESGMSQIQFGDGSTSSYQQDIESNADSYFDQRFSHSRPSSRPRSSRSSSKKPKSKGGWTLFIQMQLCPSKLILSMRNVILPMFILFCLLFH
jgi:hypothetical protein